MACVHVPFDAQALPVVEFLMDVLPCLHRLQSQGIAAHVYAKVALMWRDQELISEGSQVVLVVHLTGERSCIFKPHVGEVRI
jgi:hypothetical protein